jgi:hypothetical protein
MKMNRHRNIIHKVYLPDSKRENQYLLAEFAITAQLVETFRNVADATTTKPYQGFYQKLANKVFAICENHELHNAHFIANDKLPRIRFSEEMHTWETQQQVLFFYNPKYHQSYKSFFDGNQRAHKVSIAFLATGAEIYHDAIKYHQQVLKAVKEIAKEFALPAGSIRIRDHQHLTYDLFSRDKNEQQLSKASKIRPIDRHYAINNFSVPADHSQLCYVIANLPVDRKSIEQVSLTPDNEQQYNPFYTYIANKFTEAAQQVNMNSGGVIANGLAPIIRNASHESLNYDGELLHIGFNPEFATSGFICKWNAEMLVSDIKLVFLAKSADLHEHGYGKFLNNIEKVLHNLSRELNFAKKHNELMIRFHQHIGYNL